jgi:DNA-binding CsgD family transcriptional regulator
VQDSYVLRVMIEFSDQLQEPGIALSGSTRVEHAPHMPLTRIHEVRPLSDRAARELLADRHPDLPESVRERVLREAAGNPLALEDFSTPSEASSMALMPFVPLGDRVRDSYERRLAPLSVGAREALLLAALDQGDDLIRLSATGALPAVRAALSSAEAARLVTIGSDEKLIFEHILVRNAVVDLATAEQRRGAHATWAKALSESDPVRSIYHRAEAAIGPDEELATALEGVARQARGRGDELGAVAAATKSAQLSADPAGRARRLAGAAYFGMLSGRPKSASDLLSHARRTDADIHGSFADLAIAAFLMLHGDGDVDAAYRLVADAIDAHPDPGDSSDPGLDLALRTLFKMALMADRGDLFDGCRRRLERLREPIGEPMALALASARLSSFQPADLSQYDRAIARSTEHGLDDLLWVANNAVLLTRVDELRPILEATLPQMTGDAEGSRIEIEFMIAYAGLRTGDWDDAVRIAQAGLDRINEQTPGLAGWALVAVQAQIAAHRGDLVAARAAADALMAWATPRKIGAAQHFALQIRSAAAFSVGDFEEAFRILELISPIGTLAHGVSSSTVVAMDLVRAAMRTDRSEQAQAHVRALEQAGTDRLSPFLALLTAGSAALAAGSGPEAVERFERALATPGAERWPFELARIRLAYGELLRRQGSVSLSRQQFSAARAVFVRLDARPMTARADAEMAATGEASSDQAVQPQSGVLSRLSPQEWQVASLAAAGLTNKQIAATLFLSPRTVANHLHRVFPKLSVTSRAGLRDALSRNG